MMGSEMGQGKEGSTIHLLISGTDYKDTSVENHVII